MRFISAVAAIVPIHAIASITSITSVVAVISFRTFTALVTMRLKVFGSDRELLGFRGWHGERRLLTLLCHLLRHVARDVNGILPPAGRGGRCRCSFGSSRCLGS
jgi:hypothetical protein